MKHITRRSFAQAIGAGAAAVPLQALSAASAEGQASARAASRIGKPDEICDLSAVDMAARLRRRGYRPAKYGRTSRAIERINPVKDVTLVAERWPTLRAPTRAWRARSASCTATSGHKDPDTVRCNTRGSRSQRQRAEDRCHRDPHSAAGAITRGTSTPVRRHPAFNAVPGATQTLRSTKTCGGSSGAPYLVCG